MNACSSRDRVGAARGRRSSVMRAAGSRGFAGGGGVSVMPV